MAQLRETVRAAFAHYDADGSGAIDATELRSLVADLGGYLTDEEFAAALVSLDHDGDGAIDEEEFTAWWTAQSGDLDGDGYVSEAERAMERVVARGQDRFRVDIHSAAWRGAVDVVQRLLEQDSELVHEGDATEYGDGNTALHYAAYQGHAEVCQVLLTAGAKINAVNASGCTPLFLAAQQSRHAAVTLLLDRGADIRIPERQHRLTAVDVCFDDVILASFRGRAGGVPCVPDAPSIVATLETSISIEWTTPKDKHDQTAPISGYKIRATAVDTAAAEPRAVLVLVGALPTRHTVERLAPETTYTIQLAAINLHGISAFSAPSEPTRTSPARTRPPTQLRARPLGASTIEITWTSDATDAAARFIAQQCVDQNADLWKVVGKVDATKSESQCRLVVENLLDATKYRFRVAAISSTGEQGDFSAPVEARTRTLSGDDAKLTARGAGPEARVAVRDIVGVVHKLRADAKQHVVVRPLDYPSPQNAIAGKVAMTGASKASRAIGAVRSGRPEKESGSGEPTAHAEVTPRAGAKKPTATEKNDQRQPPQPSHKASAASHASDSDDDAYVYFSDSEEE